MAKYRYEMFANLTYGEELTYEELIIHEQVLTDGLAECLEDMGASHVDFRPSGDALYVQCVFDDQDARNFEDICERATALAGEKMEGRLLFFGRDLGRLYCFFLAGGKWQSGRLSLPSPTEGVKQMAPEMQYSSSKNRKKTTTPKK